MTSPIKKPRYPQVKWRYTLALLSSLFLQGCGVPGFAILGETQTQDRNNERILGYRPVSEAAPLEGPDGMQVYAITPGLLKKQMQEMPVSLSSDIRELIGVSEPYAIGPSDVISIIVYDHPEFLPTSGTVISQTADPTGVSAAPGFIVSAAGEISFPYIGRTNIKGLSEIEAADLIANKLAAVIKNPQVTVRIQSFRSKRAYVEGEVRTPGLQIFTDVPMTMAEAINRAGGITTAGDRSFISLTRANKTTTVNLQLLQELGADASNIPLRNGDILNVHNREESKVYVMGEILRPSALLMRNGKLSLNEALGESGGPNLATADPSQIYVIRNTSNGSPSVFHLDAKNPTSLALADRFALKPRDVVYVDPVPLVQWNRIISLILPAASVVNYGSQVITR